MVVVLKSGDLTAEEVDEVDMFKKKIEGWYLYKNVKFEGYTFNIKCKNALVCVANVPWPYQ